MTNDITVTQEQGQVGIETVIVGPHYRYLITDIGELLVARADEDYAIWRDVTESAPRNFFRAVCARRGFTISLHATNDEARSAFAQALAATKGK